MPGDMCEIGNELAERDQQDQAAADGVGGEHQSLLVVPVGVHPGEWTEEDGGERVREKEGGAVGARPADAVGEDEQREHQELVGQLRGDLSRPDQAEVPVGEHGLEARLRKDDVARVAARADLVWLLQGA